MSYVVHQDGTAAENRDGPSVAGFAQFLGVVVVVGAVAFYVGPKMLRAAAL